MKLHLEQSPPTGPSSRLADRLRRAFAHDLRTPLGSIVNYAAVLETSQDPPGEEVKELAGRIRSNAQRIAAMLRSLLEATELANAPPLVIRADLLALARTLLAEVGGRGAVRLAPTTTGPLAELDAHTLAFTWRAYFAIVCGSTSPFELDVELGLSNEQGQLALELRCGCAAAPDEPGDGGEDEGDVQTFLQRAGQPTRLEGALGLTLAEEILSSRGASVRVWGRPSCPSGLRVRFAGPSSLSE